MTFDQTTLAEIASRVATRNCALLTGSGTTEGSGGARWTQLIDFLKAEFRYSSPLTEPFEIIGDIARKNGPDRVYAAVQRRLERAVANQSLVRLAGLPWFATFTTNYDCALERALPASHRETINVILTGQEFPLPGLPTELLCVKLMGSADVQYGSPGAMVLDQGDLAVAREQRSEIFRILATHAANIAFLFIGYSFDDGLFLEVLQRLNKALGEPRQAYYALFLHEPSPEKAYLLKQLGVRYLVGELDSFVAELGSEVGKRNPADHTKLRLGLGSDALVVDSTKIAAFLELHNPVTLNDLQEPVPASAFFRGKTDSLHPFVVRWAFHRSAMDQLLDSVTSGLNQTGSIQIIPVKGNPGTGRRFTILAAVTELIREHRALALRIRPGAFAAVPTPDLFEVFLSEVKTASQLANCQPPTMLVLWAEFEPDSTCFAQCARLATTLDMPAFLIYEGPSGLDDIGASVGRAGPRSIRITDSVSDDERAALVQYLVQAAKDHRFPEITPELSDRIVREESGFLATVYRFLDPARRSIDAIVADTYAGISDPAERACLALCALASAVGFDLPFSVLRKALENRLNRPVSYEEVFDLVETRGHNLLRESQDIRTNYYAAVFHPIVARHLTNLAGAPEMHRLLLAVASTIELESRVDAEFASSLFIAGGVNRVLDHRPTPFSQAGLLEALETLRRRQPARPVLHHLARLYYSQDRNGEQVIPLLEQAAQLTVDRYALSERRGNVLTTLANVRWDRCRVRTAPLRRSDPDVAECLRLLDEAMSDPTARGIHPYDIYVRILRDVWAASEDESERYGLVNEALDVLQSGIDAGIDSPTDPGRLEALRIEVLREVNREAAEAAAKSILLASGDGTGYYVLARAAYFQDNDTNLANSMLETALGAHQVPGGAIALKIEILLQDKAPNYDYLLRLVRRLDADSGYRDTWKSAYHKGVVYTICGQPAQAQERFLTSDRMAPVLQRRVILFWEDAATGRRRILRGRVIGRISEKEGRVLPEDVAGWPEGFFFNPRLISPEHRIRSGSMVEFELGFSPRGPQAFDLRPRRAPPLRFEG